MSDKFSKILTIVVAVISVIGLVLFINVSSVGGDDPKALDAAVGPFVFFSKYLLIAAIGITVVLSFGSLIKNPENIKKTLLGLGVLAVISVLAYVLGDSSPVLDAQGSVIKGGEEGSSINQWVGTLIWYSTILLIIGSIFFVFDLVKGLIKS